MCRQNMCVLLHQKICFLGRQWYLDSWDVVQWRISTWKGSIINSELINYSQQNQHCMKSLQLENKDKVITRSWSRDTTGQCSATCDTLACGTSMLKEKNLQSATCHRLVHGQLVKKQFRIFFEISTISLLCNKICACICYVLYCSVFCLFVH